MKKLVLFIILLQQTVIAQNNTSTATETMVLQPEYEKCQNLNIQVPADKVVFVFFTSKALEINHEAMSKSKQRLSAYHNGMQTLTIPYEGSNGTIVLKYDNMESSISYGWVQGAKNKYPDEIKPGHHYCINVAFKKKLSYSDKTYEKDEKVQTLTETDALIVIETFPKTLKIRFKPKPYIKILKKPGNKKNGIYNLLIKPNITDQGERTITIMKKGYANLNIDLGKVQPKDYRYIKVQDDSYLSGTIEIKSEPKGAVIKIEETPDLHQRTNYIFKNKPGIYNYVLEKEGYYPAKGKFTIGEDQEVFVKLIPKKAYLSINGNDNAQNAEVFLDDKPIGTIPIINFETIEGKHKLKFKKNNFFTDRPEYEFYIKEGEHLNFSDFKILSGASVTIKSFPEKWADIYIDGKDTGKKTDGEVFLTEGMHTITVKKDYYLPRTKTVNIIKGKNRSYMFKLKVDEQAALRDNAKKRLATLTGNAENGDPEAQYKLAIYYKKKYGLGSKYKTQIMNLMKQSALQDYTDAMRFLANYYYINDNEKKYFYWYKRMAMQGDPDAQYILGALYKEGRGVTKSRKEAKFWWNAACNNGKQQACNALQNMGKAGKFFGSLLNTALESTSQTIEEALKKKK